MMAQQLPNGLLDLIEHVELNKSGWWDAALGNVLLAATWMHGEPVHRERMRDLLVAAFNLEIPPDRLAGQVERLVNQGQLSVHGEGHVAPSSTVAAQMEERLEAAEQNEETVRAAFIEKVGDCCAPHSPQEAWDLFMGRYLLPLIDVLGVRTLQLIGGDGAEDADVATLTDGFVSQFDSPHHAELRAAIGRFLDPDDANVRHYVTEHLDASFLVRASGLTSEAIADIGKFGRRPPTFRLFLDTNFLFSLLDLHENPSNESAQMLGETIQQVGQHLSIRMNVIAPTMDEIKRTLWASQASLAGMRMSPALASAATDVGLSGIAMRFARANRESGPVTSEDYFRPFLDNLSLILRGKGIEVYNRRTDEYRQRQDVVDDLHEMTVVDSGPEGERQRRYNAALHDSILWHFVHDRRPEVFESPLEAVYWVVTNDYRLLSFDRRRRRAANSAAGVCIHPAELLQMLRLWEPRSTNMEQALMSGLRLPFMFYEFDVGKEAASMRVLKALSRFDHIGELGPDTIRDIVLSDAVRSKTVQATSEEEEDEVIRDALLAERKEIVDQRDAALRRAYLAEESLASERAAAKDHDSTLLEKQGEAQKRVDELETELRDAAEDTRNMAQQVKTLENILSERDEVERVQSSRIRIALIRGVGGGVLTAAAAGAMGLAWVMVRETHPLVVSLSMIALWFVSMLLVLTTAIHDVSVKEWGPMRVLFALRHRAALLLGALILAVIGNALWELVKPYWFA